MLYTIGDTEIYESGLNDPASGFRKTGRTDDYEGGTVFARYESAVAAAVNETASTGCQYSVYGIAADRDAAEWLLIDMGWLLYDCDLFRIDSRGKRVYPHQAFHISAIRKGLLELTDE